MDDVDDRRPDRARPGEQPPDLVQRRGHLRQRQQAVDVFLLGIDHDDRRIAQPRGPRAGAGDLQQRLWAHMVSSAGASISSGSSAITSEVKARPHKATNTGEVSPVFGQLWPCPSKPDASTRVLAVSTNSRAQKAPNRMAPTKANAMPIASTFSLMARSVGICLLAVE